LQPDNGYSVPMWPLLAYAVLVFAVTSAMIGFSYLLGQRHRDRATGEVYESGISATGSARLLFSARYYIIAMFFVIFDLESAFIIAWAISFRETGWSGYIGLAIFIFILLAVLMYEWRSGALDFGPSGKKILDALHRIQKKSQNI
jgi:NADH-quinone oxidoreductase subunit A